MHRASEKQWLPVSATGVLLLALASIFQAAPQISGQDLLRRSQQSSNQNSLNAQLANIQLPPQLAQLSPQQLHQLAQLREMQLQQEAAATARQQQQEASAPAPIGMAADQQRQPPTERPAASSNSGQIPQPATSVGSGGDDDTGAYNESGSELEGVTAAAGPDANEVQPTGGAAGANSAAAAAAAPTFEVNWNKCPQLEPSESEKTKKTQVITKCLQAAPIPTNLTRENVEAHREQIATCALKVEGWFDEQGAYKYEKAESEIKSKKLETPIELQVLKFHVACKEEANKKFPRDQNKLIDQVQFYQACMDYYISIVCEIEVSVDQ